MMDLKNSGRSCLLASLLMVIGVVSQLPELSRAEHRGDVADAPIPDNGTDLLEDWYRDECARDKEIKATTASDQFIPACAVIHDPFTANNLLVSRPVAGPPPIPHEHPFHIAPENEIHDAHSQTDSPMGREADSNALLEQGSDLWNTQIITDPAESHQRQSGPHHATSARAGAPETSASLPSTSPTTPAHARPHILAPPENSNSSPFKTLTQPEPRRPKIIVRLKLSDQPAGKRSGTRSGAPETSTTRGLPSSHRTPANARPHILAPPENSNTSPFKTLTQPEPRRPQMIVRLKLSDQAVGKRSRTRSSASETSTTGLPSSHTTPANARPHILSLPENSDASPFKTLTQPEPRRSEQPVRKRIRSRKLDQLFAQFSAKHSRANPLTEAALQQDMMKFDAALFVPLDPFSEVEKAEVKHFQDKINSLPRKLMILPEDDFFFLRLFFRYRDSGQHNPTELEAQYCQYPEKTSLTQAQSSNLATKGLAQDRPPEYTAAVRRMESILREFDETHIESWYQRWFMTTGVNLRINPKSRMFEHFRDERYQERLLPLYLLHVEIICSIVREESTTSKQIAEELIWAQRRFKSLTKASLDPDTIQDNPSFKQMAKTLRVHADVMGSTPILTIDLGRMRWGNRVTSSPVVAELMPLLMERLAIIFAKQAPSLRTPSFDQLPTITSQPFGPSFLGNVFSRIILSVTPFNFK
ncbi:hypothetical protein PCASD_15565 [Puccinia coronata f. sp. avenae]|uniref:RGS domain-containing protein n=1 Tax=Puccinia coronata f. sp. avenae TaxID=200324 RepID=A0A2N5T4X9_9BASI|nr:hypothetical protein PCASD_15565 [Puccinia coronata f. sp. avenae]